MEPQPRDVPAAGTGTTYRNGPSAPTHTHTRGCVPTIIDFRLEA
jgi:hypothetical protein